ncbi:MAG: LysM peptidoglycan-binding domain-containing protein [Anaerolineales bacterium]|nr:LysM peptidoglycan-binding domain-containing protein [Anaerolineales bacterium]
MTQGLRDFGNALVIAMLSIGLMVGALSISLVEFVPEAAPTATNIVMPSPLPLTATPTIPPTLTPIPGLETPTLMVLPSSTNVLFQSTCLPPLGWGQIILQSNDTLDSLAVRYRVNRDDLKRGNCLVSDNLVAGKVLYVPPVATSTFQSCVQGAAGWVKSYTVRPGDTFYSIATNHYSTAGLLKNVNCRTSDIVYIGEVLWVPNVSTRTPFPTPQPGVTVTPYPTDPLTETALPFTITVQPSNTPVPPSATVAPTFTSMPTPTASLTAFP